MDTSAVASLRSLLNGSPDGISSLNYCNCCNAELNPAKLVFNVRTGVVTVRCDDCGKVNTVGNLERKESPPPPSIVNKPLVEISNKSVLTDLTETILLTKDVKKEDIEFCDPINRGFNRKKRFFVRIFGYDRGKTECEKTFKCQWCDYSSKLKQHVKRHERVHTLEKAYGCQYCGRKFARKETLTIHVRLHTGEKPYRCKICGESFLRKTQYNIHKENIHPVDTVQLS